MGGKKRASATGQNASGNAAAGGRGAAKRAKPSGPKKSRPTLVAGLQATLPAQPSPWLQRCIERWGLVAPYDPSVTEAQWEAYFKERAALEWHTNAFLMDGPEDSDEDEDEEEEEKSEIDGAADQQQQQQEQDSQPSVWPFDWEKPASLGAFCQEFYGCDNTEEQELGDFLDEMRTRVQRVIAGCKGLPSAAQLAAALSSGVFITDYHICWEDQDDPRTVELHTRIYSPCALATSIAFSYTWHQRARSCFAEHFCSCVYQLRGAGDVKPQQPQNRGGACTNLFSMDMQDSGYKKRKFLGVQGLRGLAAHLLGRKGLISERKAFSLATLSAGITAVPGAPAGFAFRVTRRKHKLLAGEESDADSADDSDSDNESMKNARSRYSGLGGWGGSGDVWGDDDDGSEGDADGPGVECHVM